MRILSSSDLERTLAEAVERLCGALAPVAIYLYGSCAYGTPGPGSDIDPFVVVPHSALSPTKRDAVAYRALIGLGVPKDVQVHTRKEFDDRAALLVSFERTVKKKGRVLYAA